jgi:hypothetical protein
VKKLRRRLSEDDRKRLMKDVNEAKAGAARLLSSSHVRPSTLSAFEELIADLGQEIAERAELRQTGDV